MRITYILFLSSYYLISILKYYKWEIVRVKRAVRTMKGDTATSCRSAAPTCALISLKLLIRHPNRPAQAPTDRLSNQPNLGNKTSKRKALYSKS